jgi:Leucine-rich repeat (LRR) protein
MKKQIAGKKKRRLLKAFIICVIAAAAFGLLFIAYKINSTSSQSYKESDKNLNMIIGAREFNKFPSSLTNEDFLKVESLTVYKDEMTNLEPLAKLKNLKKITFDASSNQDIDLDFWPLAKLEKLKTLVIQSFEYGKIDGIFVIANDWNQFHYIFPIKKKQHWYGKVFSFFRKLKSLQTEPAPFDVGRFRKLKQLDSLTIQGFRLRNIEALSALENLESLTIISDMFQVADEAFGDKQNNPELLDPSPLANLTKLSTLNISYIKARDYKFLQKLSYLESLNLTRTNIADISSLANLKNLRELDLRDTKVTDEQIRELQKALPELKILK